MGLWSGASVAATTSRQPQLLPLILGTHCIYRRLFLGYILKMCRQLNILCRDVDHRATDVSRDDSKLLIWILSPGTKIVRWTSIPRFACRGLGTWEIFRVLFPFTSLFALYFRYLQLYAFCLRYRRHPFPPELQRSRNIYSVFQHIVILNRSVGTCGLCR